MHTEIINDYYTIAQPGIAEFKDKGSRFVAYAFPVNSVDEFKEQLAAVKKEHPKATHHCFAYRIGLDGTLFRVSDDGEPSGSAGRPILGQIDSKSLTNVLIIVVRYFGGTLLGVPGLINAYKTSASLVLQVTPLAKKPVMVHYRLQFDYPLMNDIMVTLKRFECVVVKQDNQLFPMLEIAIPKANLTEVIEKLESLHLLELRQL